MDIVTSNYLNENTRIYFDGSHKWYYWHGLQADEVIAFVQADSQEENRAGMMNFTLWPREFISSNFDTKTY